MTRHRNFFLVSTACLALTSLSQAGDPEDTFENFSRAASSSQVQSTIYDDAHPHSPLAFPNPQKAHIEKAKQRLPYEQFDAVARMCFEPAQEAYILSVMSPDFDLGKLPLLKHFLSTLVQEWSTREIIENAVSFSRAQLLAIENAGFQAAHRDAALEKLPKDFATNILPLLKHFLSDFEKERHAKWIIKNAGAFSKAQLQSIERMGFEPMHRSTVLSHLPKDFDVDILVILKPFFTDIQDWLIAGQLIKNAGSFSKAQLESIERTGFEPMHRSTVLTHLSRDFDNQILAPLKGLLTGVQQYCEIYHIVRDAQRFSSDALAIIVNAEFEPKNIWAVLYKLPNDFDSQILIPLKTLLTNTSGGADMIEYAQRFSIRRLEAIANLGFKAGHRCTILRNLPADFTHSTLLSLKALLADVPTDVRAMDSIQNAVHFSKQEMDALNATGFETAHKWQVLAHLPQRFKGEILPRLKTLLAGTPSHWGDENIIKASRSPLDFLDALNRTDFAPAHRKHVLSGASQELDLLPALKALLEGVQDEPDVQKIVSHAGKYPAAHLDIIARAEFAPRHREAVLAKFAKNAPDSVPLLRLRKQLAHVQDESDVQEVASGFPQISAKYQEIFLREGIEPEYRMHALSQILQNTPKLDVLLRLKALLAGVKEWFAVQEIIKNAPRFSPAQQIALAATNFEPTHMHSILSNLGQDFNTDWLPCLKTLLTGVEAWWDAEQIVKNIRFLDAPLQDALAATNFEPIHRGHLFSELPFAFNPDVLPPLKELLTDVRKGWDAREILKKTLPFSAGQMMAVAQINFAPGHRMHVFAGLPQHFNTDVLSPLKILLTGIQEGCDVTGITKLAFSLPIEKVRAVADMDVCTNERAWTLKEARTLASEKLEALKTLLQNPRINRLMERELISYSSRIDIGAFPILASILEGAPAVPTFASPYLAQRLLKACLGKPLETLRSAAALPLDQRLAFLSDDSSAE